MFSKLVLLLSLLWAHSAFAEPLCLKPNIDFWQSIYTQYSKDQGVIHHAYTFEVYKVVDLPVDKKPRKAMVQGEIDLVRALHPHIAPEHIRMQTGVREQYIAGVVRYQKYRNKIEALLSKAGLPTQLILIPAVESLFNPQAGSHAGAQGMFQIMPATARTFMKRKVSNKELRQFEFSANLGIRILEHNYSQLGSWPLAYMAYHSGLSGMHRAVAEVGTKDECKIINEYKGKSFKFASRNYYAQILALQRLLAL